ncbi:Flavin-linked sulfhydryl oxidase of the mitochondrial IMS [Cystobasidiomycetes sp. EMM_F5]
MADVAVDENRPPLGAASSSKLAPGYRIGPNGVILGPDGKPCKACNSLKSFGAIAAAGGKGKQKAHSSINTGLAGSAAVAATQIKQGVPAAYRDCPADVEKLGRHTWTFLHSTAAYYPERPSESHKKNAMGLFGSLPSLYPCRYCADELEKEMKRLGPPDVSSRWSLSQWLCQIHNEVNTRLGKQEFDCSRVLERWKDGPADGSCDL